MSLDDLLAECAAHPDDDQPRLVWGDAVGGDRGELVAIQCAPRDALTPAELAVLNRRERALLQHAWDWSGLAGLVHRVRFRRGFVDAIDVDAGAWIEHGEHIVAAAPLVTALTIRDVDGADRLRSALESPAFARIRALHILPFERSFDAVQVLASTGVLRQVTALGLAIEVDSAFRLAQAGIAHIERLQLHGPAGQQAIRAIALAATGVTALTADHVPDASFATGFPQLVDVDLHVPGDWLRVVRPLAPRLQRLAITGQSLLANPRELARFTALRVLEIRRGAYTGDAVRELAAHAPATLRELRLFDRDRATVVALATKLAPHLDLLDLRDAVRVEPIACDCDVLLDEPITYELFHAGRRARAEWRLPPPPRTELPGAPAWLAFESGPEAGRIWDLTEHGAARVGRSVDVAISVPHESIGRHHAELRWRDGRHWLRDMRSTNGSYVDGARVVDDVALADGARISFGFMLARFFTGPGGGTRASACVRELAVVDARTGLPRARAEAVGAILAVQTSWGGELVLAEIARQLVSAAGPGVSVTWIGRVGDHRHAFGITPGGNAAELATACAGVVRLATGEALSVRLDLVRR